MADVTPVKKTVPNREVWNRFFCVNTYLKTDSCRANKIEFQEFLEIYYSPIGSHIQTPEINLATSSTVDILPWKSDSRSTFSGRPRKPTVEIYEADLLIFWTWAPDIFLRSHLKGKVFAKLNMPRIISELKETTSEQMGSNLRAVFNRVIWAISRSDLKNAWNKWWFVSRKCCNSEQGLSIYKLNEANQQGTWSGSCTHDIIHELEGICGKNRKNINKHTIR